MNTESDHRDVRTNETGSTSVSDINLQRTHGGGEIEAWTGCSRTRAHHRLVPEKTSRCRKADEVPAPSPRHTKNRAPHRIAETS